MGNTSPVGRYVLNPPSTVGLSRFRNRMLANVQRAITSSLPRRDPYELKSFTATPFESRYLPAGLSFLMDPAGEMWSVVMLSPIRARTRASRMSFTSAGVRGMSSTYGGCLMYVEFASHLKRSP